MSDINGKKILLVITKSNWGGAQAYVYALAKNLRERGADVLVAFGGTGLPNAETGLLSRRLSAESIRTHVFPSFARDVSLSREISAFKELNTLLKQEHPDILLLSSSKAGGLGSLAGRLQRVPRIIYTAHGWAHNETRSFLSKMLIRTFSWLTITFCDVVIVVSQLDYMTAPVLFSRSKLRIIRNGITDFDRLTKASARETLNSIMVIPQSVPWILMQAELHKNKGVDTAISSLPKVLESFPTTVLVVMGEGEERMALERKIRELHVEHSVFLLGFVADSRSYLEAADMYIMPSRKEGLPMAILEAGMASLPIIASNVGGIPEIIQDRQNGLLIHPDDVIKLSTQIIELLASPERRQQYGRAAHSLVVGEFTENTMIEKTVDLF